LARRAAASAIDLLLESHRVRRRRLKQPPPTIMGESNSK
jgi:hypothetical protein